MMTQQFVTLMDQDIHANPVSRLVCSNCNHEMDVAGRQPFSFVSCEQCGTQLTVPVMLGQFLLLEKMGTGGMGSVYRALDTALNRFVAIKVMKAALGEDNKLVQSFITEAQAAAALNHPNIVQIYSCGTEKGQPYIVMELVTGGQMNHMFSRDEPMNETKLLKFAMDVAQGLKAANEVGLVHGDIKPENVLIDQNGTAKIVDFGLAQFVNAQKDRGEIWGTPYYISPERARGNKADHRSDIYSLGASMFHALTGKPPFDGKTAADVVLERLKHPPPDIRELRQGLQTETVELIDRMMAADPHLRYPNSASLMADMKAAMEAAKAASKQSRSRQKKGNKSSLIVAALAVALTAGLGFMFYRMIQAEKNKPVRVSTPKPAAEKPTAQEEASEPEEDLFTVEEITGADGKIRLKMNIRFFEEKEEVALTAAARAITDEGLEESQKQFAEFARTLPRNSVRAMWVPVLNAVTLWASGDDAQAMRGLERVSSSKINKKDDHPAHMPRVIASYLTGGLSESELREFRREWPAWFGDLVNLLDGVKHLQAGDNEAGWRMLKAYLERQRAEPEWVYAFRPAVRQWSQSFQDWEDMSRRVERQLEMGIVGPARQALERYRREVPPMLAGELRAAFEKIDAIERAQADAAAEEEARLHRLAVQQDLNKIDEKMRELSPMIIRDRDYRKASISLSRLPSMMETDQGREAARYTRELVESLDRLKNYIIKSSESLRYRRSDGCDLGGDLLSANALGVKVSLDGRAVTSLGWDEISLRSYLLMADFYASAKQFPVRERAEAYVSIGVFCLMNGAFEPAAKYASRALEIKPELETRLRRLMPGLPIRDV